MADEPLHRMPDEVTVPLTELADAMSELESVLLSLDRAGSRDVVTVVDGVVGRMTRWIWPLLGELDRGDGYDG